MTRVVVALVAAASLGAAAPVTAYPAITCGRTSFDSVRYVVKSHGPTCPFAIRNLKAFIAHRTSPALFKCRRYGANVPAYCTGTGKYSKRYFFASKP